MTDIPSYHLKITEHHLRRLADNERIELKVPATLTVMDRSVPVALSYRGAHTRKFAKKSFQMELLSDQLSPTEREIHLNAEFVDPSLMRNKLSFDFFSDIGALAPKAQHILLYLNGTCAGIYLKLESVDEQFLRNRHLGNGPIYYAINSNANFSLFSPKTQEVKESLEDGYYRKCGAEDDDAFLRELVYTTITTPQSQFEEEISKILEIDNYLRWLAGAVCTQNFDGFIHNYALYRNEETGRFSIIPWDYDATWGRNVNGNVLSHTSIPIDGFNTLTARLLDVPNLRKQYCLILEEILNTTFTPAAMKPKIMSMHQLLRPYLPLDPYKREQMESFDAEPAFILSFIQNRNDYLRQNLNTFRTSL